MQDRGTTALAGMALFVLLAVGNACSEDSADFSPPGSGSGEGGEPGASGGATTSGSPGAPEGGDTSSGGSGQGQAGTTGVAGSAGTAGTGGVAPSLGGAGGADPTQAGGAGAPEGGAPDGGAPGNDDEVVADALVTPDLAGLPTLLNAAGSEGPLSQDLAFDWAITAVPVGSAVSDADLDDDTLEETFFVPDLGGGYRVSLTVTAEDGRSDSVLVDFDVPVAQVPYLRVVSTSTQSTATAFAVNSDGTGSRAIGCESVLGATNEQRLVENFDAEVGLSTDAWYPEDPADDALFASPTTTDTDLLGTPQESLVEIRSSASSCEDMPVASLAAILGPRFSPSGTRVAFVSADIDGVATASVTGTSPRSIKGTVDGPLGSTAMPFWLSESRVGWVEGSAGGGNDFDLWAGDDSDTPNAEPIMLCTGEEGEFLAARMLAMTSVGLTGVLRTGTGYNSLYALQPMDDGTYSCVASEHALIYTTPAPTNDLLGFSVSPDREMLLIVVGDTTANTSPAEITLSDAGGEGAITIAEGGERNLAPHFIAGGKQVVWTRTVYDTSGNSPRPSAVGIWRANADGSVRVLIHGETSSETDAVLLTTGTHTCSVSFARARGSGFAAGALALVGLFALCRRKGSRR